MNKIIAFIQCRQPVATAGLVRVLLLFVVSMGWSHLTDAQIASVLIAVEAVLSYWLKSAVVSQDTHNDAVNAALRLDSSATREDLAAVLDARKQLEVMNR